MHTIHQPDPTLSLMNNNGMDTPAWLPRAVIAEVNLMHATPAGTIDAAISTLDYFADLGVNCLWIDPINEMGHSFTYPNGYTTIGLDTVEPALSGTDDYAAGWREFGRFVDAAHERGLRVLLDVVILLEVVFPSALMVISVTETVSRSMEPDSMPRVDCTRVR